MAAGLIQVTTTVKTGSDIALTFLVDDTGTPTKYYNATIPVNSAGATAAFGSGANGATVLRVAQATDGPGVLDQVAHAAADSGNPIKQGFRATTSLAGLTLVADANRTNGHAGIDGAQIVRTHCNLEDIVTGTPVAITDGSSTSVIASQGAGVKFYLTSMAIANTSATAVTVDLRDGAAGAVKWTVPVPANTSGIVYSFPVPLPFSAATAVCADPSAAASTITVSLLGFKSKV